MTLLRLISRDLGVYPPPTAREFAAALIASVLVIAGLGAAFALLVAVVPQ